MALPCRFANTCRIIRLIRAADGSSPRRRQMLRSGAAARIVRRTPRERARLCPPARCRSSRRDMREKLRISSINSPMRAAPWRTCSDSAGRPRQAGPCNLPAGMFAKPSMARSGIRRSCETEYARVSSSLFAVIELCGAIRLLASPSLDSAVRISSSLACVLMRARRTLDAERQYRSPVLQLPASSGVNVLGSVE